MTARTLALLLGVLTLGGGASRAQGRIDFEKEILPLLDNYCTDCHADPAPKKRAKGGLRLDGIGWILRGGDGGRVLLPGVPEKSALYTRTALPPAHEDVMPPKGERMTKKEQELLRNWVRQGANFGGWKGEPGPVKKPKKIETKKGDVSPRVAAWMRLSEDLRPASKSQLQRARAGLAFIEPIMSQSPLLKVRYTSREPEVTDTIVQALAPIRQNVTNLNLRRCQKVTDAALAACGQMPRLTRLDLGGTGVTDRGLFRLTTLVELRTISLYGTKVTDAGLDTLSKLPQLRTVYVWKTRTSKAGAQRLERRLKKRHPEARVVREPGLPKPPPARR